MDDIFLTPEQQSALTERICAGDRGAEKELVECFSRRVFALLVARTRDREASRDLFQEVMLAITIALRLVNYARPKSWDGSSRVRHETLPTIICGSEDGGRLKIRFPLTWRPRLCPTPWKHRNVTRWSAKPLNSSMSRTRTS